MTPARLRTAAVLGLAGIALAACGTNPSGAASVVGTQTVRDAEVAAAVDELSLQIRRLPNGQVDESQATGLTVQRMTRHLILEEAARDKGVVVTQADIDALIAQSVAGVGGKRSDLDAALATQDFVPASAVEEYGRDFLIRQKLDTAIAPGKTTDEQTAAVSAYFTQLAKQLDVRVAPRFGTWDVYSIGPLPDDLSVPPSSAGSGSSPTPEPSASASASPTG